MEDVFKIYISHQNIVYIDVLRLSAKQLVKKLFKNVPKFKLQKNSKNKLSQLTEKKKRIYKNESVTLICYVQSVPVT